MSPISLRGSPPLSVTVEVVLRLAREIELLEVGVMPLLKLIIWSVVRLKLLVDGVILESDKILVLLVMLMFMDDAAAVVVDIGDVMLE